ncbi:MAG: tetratricopeptide repeat protein [Woeseiaceae bacterium]|nr:tetratricopeptide repeat protein [Woeseiaceae bacterium]
MSLVVELRRRNVFRVAAAYLVVGWLLTEVLTTILPTLGAPEWMSRAVILIFAFGFIPAVVFSWFFELTPEGIKREEDVRRDEPGQQRLVRKFDYATLAGVVVLIVIIALFSARQTDEGVESASIAANNASVAVLPFANMSNDPDNEYFSDGLTETLLHMLAQIPDLQVAARTSSFAFKGQNVNVREIAAALGVAHILEGSVQRAGEEVRITAQLIRASDGFHVWSEVYDRTVDDIFNTQDEIARKVGYALTQSLLGPDEAPVAGVDTADPDAYDLYLQARKARATYSYGGLKAAEDLLKGTLLIDPDFLDAKTELASSYVHQYETGLMEGQEAVNEILAIISEVLEARPDDPVARATEVYANALDDIFAGDFQTIGRAIPELEAIVANHPDELQPRILLVRTYMSLQQNDKAIPVLEAALGADPYNPQILYELGTTYYRMDQWDKARAALEKSLEIEPRQPNGYNYLARISRHEGDGVGFVDNFFKALAVDPEDHELAGVLAEFLYELRLVEQGDDLRRRVQTLAPTSAMAYRLDLVRAMALEDDAAATAAARRAIVDNIEERRNSWSGAVQYLLMHGIKTNTVEDQMAWIDAQIPGGFDLEGDAVSHKHRMAQELAINGWYASLPREEALRRLDLLLDSVRALGVEPMDNRRMAANVHAMRGEIDEALEIVLQLIQSESVASNLGWQETAFLPQFTEIMNDPRVQAALERWMAEEEQLRADVRGYLEDLQSAS